MEDIFWADNLQILFAKEKLMDFIPKKGMSENQMYNAVVRFSIYLSAILIMYYNNLNYFSVAIMGLLGTYIYKHYLNVEEHFEETTDSKQSNNLDDLDMKISDSNCRKPTKDNPFMNRLPTDDLSNIKPACELTSNIKKEVDTLFNEDLEAQEEHIYNPDFNQRAFYTTPVTEATNDQETFRNWLYKSEEQCKFEKDMELSNSVRGCKGIVGYNSVCSQEFSIL